MILDELFYFSYSYDIEYQLIQAIKQQQQTQVLKLLDQHKHVEVARKLSTDLARKNSLALLTNISRSLLYPHELTRLNHFNSSMLSHLEPCETLDEVHAILVSQMLSLFQTQDKQLSTNQLCLEIKHFVALHVKSALTVKQIANHFGYSISYVSRVFSQTENITLKTYILNQKLETAKLLLMTTSLSISEISEVLAFYRCDYFSRAFKNYTDLSPHHYRALYLQTH